MRNNNLHFEQNNILFFRLLVDEDDDEDEMGGVGLDADAGKTEGQKLLPDGSPTNGDVCNLY